MLVVEVHDDVGMEPPTATIDDELAAGIDGLHHGRLPITAPPQQAPGSTAAAADGSAGTTAAPPRTAAPPARRDPGHRERDPVREGRRRNTLPDRRAAGAGRLAPPDRGHPRRGRGIAARVRALAGTRRPPVHLGRRRADPRRRDAARRWARRSGCPSPRNAELERAAAQPATAPRLHERDLRMADIPAGARLEHGPARPGRDLAGGGGPQRLDPPWRARRSSAGKFEAVRELFRAPPIHGRALYSRAGEGESPARSTRRSPSSRRRGGRLLPAPRRGRLPGEDHPRRARRGARGLSMTRARQSRPGLGRLEGRRAMAPTGTDLPTCVVKAGAWLTSTRRERDERRPSAGRRRSGSSWKRRRAACWKRSPTASCARPSLEYTPLFVRSVGEVTDVVEKQMYTFDDRDGRSVTLRPEGTAPRVRAYIENAQWNKEPVTRWYYIGPDVPPRAGAARPAAPVPPDRRRVVRRQRAVGRRRDDRHADDDARRASASRPSRWR